MTARIFSRREFLLSLAAAAGSCALSRAWAYPIGTILGPGNPAYIAEYLRRLMNWYDHRFFDFTKAMSADERGFLESCTRDFARWDYPLSKAQAFNHFLVSHSAVNGIIDHSRLAIGSESLTSEQKNLARQVLRHHGIKLPSDVDGLYGLGWDFHQGIVKTYHLHLKPSDLRDNSLLAIASAKEEDDLFPQRISSYSFKNGRLVSSKLILAYRELPSEAIRRVPFGPSVVGVMQIRSPSNESRWHYRLKSFDLDFLSAEGKEAGRAHYKEFWQMTNSLIWKDERDYTLYYP